ncbi:hypothetical protein APHAL10511_006103 [Amanita phalloides]|nr:hypothetical protein APHAL10511_006103 [Amanita phalloides]
MIIPDELISEILDFLDLRQLILCRAVCSTFRFLIDSQLSFQYKIELAIAGQEDGTQHTLVARREMLKQHQKSWAALRWTQEQRVLMFHGGLWELYGNVLAQNDPGGLALHFKQLPSQSRGIDEKNWTIDVSHFRVRDFGMDPAQDLLIIVEQPQWQPNDRSYRIHLRALSTGQIHPLGSGSRVLSHEQQWRDHVTYSIQTCGDTLAILLDSHEFNETEVVLWNWKTGQVLANIVSDDIKSISFLSDRHLILGILRMSIILEKLEPNLVVVDFIAEGPERRWMDTLENACTFRFPSLADTATALDIEVRSDPAPTWAPDSNLSVPFFIARYKRLYVITLLMHTGANFPTTLVLYAIGNTFLSLIERPAGMKTALFDWDTWGPDGSRMTISPFPQSSTWVCYVYGTRSVSRLRNCYVLMLDFNQLALRFYKERGDQNAVDTADDEDERLVCVTAPSRLEAGSIFAEDVETRLGYRVKAWVMPDVVPRHAMCSEDGIVLVQDVGVSGEYRILTVIKQPLQDVDELPLPDNDFILSILHANPSRRDTRTYLASFGPRPVAKISPVSLPTTLPSKGTLSTPKDLAPVATSHLDANTLVASILDPIHRRTALVKIQGPFSDVQLDSICRGLVYLEKLGLVSVIVVENDTLRRGEEDERSAIIAETSRVVSRLERLGARARPVLGPVVRLGPKPDESSNSAQGFVPPEAHTVPPDLAPIRSALLAGEIPVIAPFALDSFCRSVRIHADDIVGGLARGMVEVSQASTAQTADQNSEEEQILSSEVDLTPLRLMIINREGGVPSYARTGYPHLLVNLTSEYSYIKNTFQEQWHHSHPSALSNLALAKTCLAYMPPSSSAIMVSHRSPSSLIGNLITNKPAVSSSLPHALLQGNRKLTPHTPTLLRRGLPIQVIRSVADIDRVRLNALLEQSFGRTLNEASFYSRLEKTLDFVIVAGDYAGAAIVTREPCPALGEPIAYLDKFAVLPSHQGDGTVDFLWVALHDESYGLGHAFSANPNGGKGGVGEGYDLVWRSRADNPVNKWYFERSSGHLRIGSWVMFWCDAEKRLRVEEGRRGSAGLSYFEDWEKGRFSAWTDVVASIPSSWTK